MANYTIGTLDVLMLNDRNVTNSDQKLLCVTASISPLNYPRIGGLLTV